MKQLTIFNSENAEREKGFSYLCAWIYTLTITLTPDSMKTTQATVNLVLNEQRKNKDGLCPVVLRIFWKGRKDRQTDIYIPKSQWLVKEASSLGKKRTGGVITTAPALFLHTHEYFSI